MRIFGVDPGSVCTGYGCIETSGSRHRLVASGALSVPTRLQFAEKLLFLHTGLAELLSKHSPEAVAVEDLFYAKNARSASKLGHVRGVVLLAASQAGLPVAEYTPTQVKQAVVGYGRAGKHQVQEMVTLLLGLDEQPSPLDASDALAVAVCHAHLQGVVQIEIAKNRPEAPAPRTWRKYSPRDRSSS